MMSAMGSGPDALTPREAQVLAAVGRRLANPEIADELVLSVRTVESHIAALRRKLGLDSRPGLVAAARSPHRAPVRPAADSLVGRDGELTATADLLAAHRLVTLTGPAGCGKTRLAEEVAARRAERVVVVELDRVDAAGVLAAVTAAAGVRSEAGTGLLAATALALSGGPHLLVLDDCRPRERGSRGRGDGPARPGPRLRVLATSRGPLGAAGEAVLVLAPLPTAPGAARRRGPPLPRPRRRRRAAAPTSPTSTWSPASAAGSTACPWPSSWPRPASGTCPCPSWPTCSTSGSTCSATPRAPIATAPSTPPSAGRGTCSTTPSAACSPVWPRCPTRSTWRWPTSSAAPDAGRAVLRLLDRSLLTAAGGEPRRFRLLDALRTFVLDRSDPAVATAVRRAHAVHHAELAARLAARIRTDDGVEHAHRARTAMPDITAALTWTVVHLPAAAPRLAAALATLAEHVGPDPACLVAVADATRDPGVRERASAVAAARDGRRTGLPLGGPTARRRRPGPDQGRRPGGRTGRPPPRRRRCRLRRRLTPTPSQRRPPTPEALAHLDRAARLADELDDRRQGAAIHQLRGIALMRRDPAAALEAFAAAVEAHAAAGDAMHVSNARYMMARAAAEAGVRRDEAVGWAEQSIAYARERGQAHELAHARLALADLRPGPDGAAHAEAALPVFRAVGDLRCVTRSYLRLARDRPAARGRGAAGGGAGRGAGGGGPAPGGRRYSRGWSGRGGSRVRSARPRWRSGGWRRRSGAEAAERACPAGLAAELDRWRGAWPRAGRRRSGADAPSLTRAAAYCGCHPPRVGAPPSASSRASSGLSMSAPRLRAVASAAGSAEPAVVQVRAHDELAHVAARGERGQPSRAAPRPASGSPWSSASVITVSSTCAWIQW